MNPEIHGAQFEIARRHGLLVEGASEGQPYYLSGRALKTVLLFPAGQLRHDNSVAGLQLHVLLGLLPADDLFVVEGKLLLLPILLA